MTDLETLATDGFLFTDTSVEMAMLTADFGEGYEAGANVGHPDGLRTWTIKIDVLPGDTDQVPGIADGLDYAVTYLLTEDGAPGVGFLLREDGTRFVREYGAGISTRAAYLWRFFLKSKRLGNKPFWIEAEDPEDGQWKFFLASFVEHKLSYQILCTKVFSTGLQLRQRRLAGVDSPVAPLAL